MVGVQTPPLPPPSPHINAFKFSQLCGVISSLTYGDVTRDYRQRQFLAQHSVAVLEQRCNHSKQYRNNVATLCCAKNRRCESFRVTSPLRRVTFKFGSVTNFKALLFPVV